MANQPTPDEAARALNDVEQRRKQAAGSTRGSLWVDAVSGVLIFVLSASADFFGRDASAWFSWALIAFGLAYIVLLRTRRGSALLGRPTRVRRDALSPLYRRVPTLAFLGVIVIVVALTITGVVPQVPYATTILGAVFAIILIVFGRKIQDGMNSLATRGRRAQDGAADGAR